MKWYVISLFVLTLAAPQAAAKPSGEASLLKLCDAFGETRAECSCYITEVKRLYSPADVTLAGGVARAFMSGEEPEAIAAYLLMTRKLTITRANALYKLGDKHAERVGDACEDKSQKITPEIRAKRKAMEKRLETIGARYGVGP